MKVALRDEGYRKGYQVKVKKMILSCGTGENVQLRFRTLNQTKNYTIVTAKLLLTGRCRINLRSELIPHPKVKKPVVKKPAAVKTPAVKKPAVEKPAVKKPSVKKPAAKKNEVEVEVEVPEVEVPEVKKLAANKTSKPKPVRILSLGDELDSVLHAYELTDT